MAQTTAVAKKEDTYSGRFTNMVMNEYSGAVSSSVKFDEFQRKLTQHLFIKVDMALKDFDAKRLSQNGGDKKTPFTWANVNVQKLAIDAVHRIELGLDALIPNHIHPIPYFNGRTKKYDIDLQIGYKGKDYYHRQMALDEPVDIRYELIFSNDKLTVYPKGRDNNVESYTLEIPQPLDRGEVVGGIGYIVYQDDTKNKLVIVSNKDFEKSQKAAKSQDFWNRHPENMKYKTIVNRTVPYIVLDPRKINESFALVEEHEYIDADTQYKIEASKESYENAGTGEVIDIDPVVEPETKTNRYLEQTAADNNDQLAEFNELFVSQKGTPAWHYAQGANMGDEKSEKRPAPDQISEWLEAYHNYDANVTKDGPGY